MSLLNNDYVTRITSSTATGSKLSLEFSNDDSPTWTMRLQQYLNFLRGEGFMIPNGAVAVNLHESVWGYEHCMPMEEEWYEGIVCVDKDIDNKPNKVYIESVFGDEMQMLSFIRKSTSQLEYDKILKVMKALDWRYYDGEPNESRLQSVVFSVSENAIKDWFNMNLAHGIVCRCSSGGFTAYFTLTEDHEPVLNVHFSVSQSTTDF